MEVKLSNLIQQFTTGQLAEYNIKNVRNVREINLATGIEFRSLESFLQEQSFCRTFKFDDFVDLGIRQLNPQELNLSEAVKTLNLKDSFNIQEAEQ
ncbi:MAG: hypothetical protein FH756_14500 [Firmicutes bacterium]|nr:hypothetical protein [Bacillota bacterium]